MPLFKTQPPEKILKNCAKRHLIMNAKTLSDIQDYVMLLEKDPQLFDQVKKELAIKHKVCLHYGSDRGYSISSMLHHDHVNQRVRMAVFITEVALNKFKQKGIS